MDMAEETAGAGPAGGEKGEEKKKEEEPTMEAGKEVVPGASGGGPNEPGARFLPLANRIGRPPLCGHSVWLNASPQRRRVVFPPLANPTGRLPLCGHGDGSVDLSHRRSIFRPLL